MENPTKEFKKEVVAAFQESLRQRIAVMKSGAAMATEGAQGEDTKSEGKYDTRAIEASYLAHGQKELISELEQALELSEQLDWLESRNRISSGAYVECDQDGRDLYFLIVPKGGGETLEVQGLEVQVVSESAPLGQLMDEARTGETVDSKYLILDVV